MHYIKNDNKRQHIFSFSRRKSGDWGIFWNDADGKACAGFLSPFFKGVPGDGIGGQTVGYTVKSVIGTTPSLPFGQPAP